MFETYARDYVLPNDLLNGTGVYAGRREAPRCMSVCVCNKISIKSSLEFDGGGDGVGDATIPYLHRNTRSD